MMMRHGRHGGGGDVQMAGDDGDRDRDGSLRVTDVFGIFCATWEYSPFSKTCVSFHI